MLETTLRPLAPLPDLPTLDEESSSTPLSEGDVIVRPVGMATRFSLFFPSVWEPYLVVDGRRLTMHTEHKHRRTFVWLGRHLPVLYRALEDRRVLHGEITDTAIVVVDIASFDDGTHLDHAQVRRALGAGTFFFAPFAILGPMPSRSELMTRLRAMYATGSRVEVRREEGGRVLGRRVVQVGRHE